MLLRPDTTYIDQVTKRAERIFPLGTEWKHFKSHFPEDDVFTNSVLDPAIGIAGELAAKTFASADWQNWISATKISLFELSTRVGLPALEDSALTKGLSQVYTMLGDTVSTFEQFGDNPEELVTELVKNAGLQVVQVISGQSSMVSQTVAQVIAAAIWAIDVVRSKIESDLAKNVALPPLQTEDPATDTWQVNRVLEVFRARGQGGVVYPDGKLAPASNADYTSLYLPAYSSHQPWQVQHRESGLAAQQGHPRDARGPKGEVRYNFDAGDASTFGFMPGTSTTLRVLQASYKYYYTVRSTPVDRYTLRCRGVDKPCYKSTKSFDGYKDCRQCVDAESVWPVKGIGWAYGGAPLNVTTPGENVGAFYSSTNKLLMNLLDTIAQPGPLLYTVDASAMNERWKDSFEGFWEFLGAEWGRYSGSGWRGLLSRLATLMISYEDREGEAVPGGRDPAMPTKLIPNPRGSRFTIPLSASIYSRMIKPYCADLLRLQRAQLHTVSVAYVPPGAGALYSNTGKLRRDDLADRFETARRELLASNKRVLVDLRHVSDPEYRRALEDSGVKPSPVNAKLHGSPGIGDSNQLLKPSLKPPRAVPRPKPSRVPPLRGVTLLAQLARQNKPRPVLVGVPLRPITTKPGEAPPVEAGSQSSAAIALGLTAIAGTLTAASIYGLQRKKIDEG